MEKIDFHLVAAAETGERVACRLADEAQAQSRRIFIRTRDRAQAQRLDTLLWTHRQGSFIPHALVEAAAPDETVLIGERLPDGATRELLINLAGDLPEDWARFAWLAEVIEQSPQDLEAARARFRHYRDHGITPDHHPEARS